MEPIVSPWLIYFIMQVDTLIFTSTVIAVISFFASGFALGVWLIDGEEKAKPIAIVGITIFIVSLGVSSFAPNQKSIIAMYAAQQITPNAIKKTIEAGKDFKDQIKGDIIDIIQSVNEKEKEENN